MQLVLSLELQLQLLRASAVDPVAPIGADPGGNAADYGYYGPAVWVGAQAVTAGSTYPNSHVDEGCRCASWACTATSPELNAALLMLWLILVVQASQRIN